MQKVGPTIHRRVRFSHKQKVRQICILSRQGPQFTGRCLHDSMARTTLPVSTDSFDPADSGQAQAGTSAGHHHSSLLATSTVILYSERFGSGHIEASSIATSSDTGLGEHPASRPELPPPCSVEDLPEIKEILEKSRKPSTTLLYRYTVNGTIS